ncbi:acyltransferase family protein [Pseudoduganella buxea]|uniref:Acyltransferase n=1 Tax=Pseudoduganella buxea TaxID=1949069 RepID=A0A6I3T373_9BURK|nr:acyltransferase family protein [Pseudoduganella buxea]MTV56068.1 acyltransferase family protein [Pseudoduganella buxea]GGC21609.1 acyltransferase [Pseudoduganella buxea]
MRYRAEIDGLRAVAVLPVILFHAGFDFFSGGFVGVDIFFVISGYLITTIIVAEIKAGNFSIVNFYERRARRILPALFFVLACSLPFAWMWLVPQDLKSLSQSLVAVMLFSSNILFWKTSGYFESAAELKPLLHTWSLAVEEQFYLFFPLLLMGVWRFGPRRVLPLLAVAALASLAIAHWGSAAQPDAAFYLLPTRGWELLIGAFAALCLLDERAWQPGRLASEAGSALGLALLLYSIFLFDKDTPFPSLYTLVPTAGTALVILFATPATTVGRLLGRRALVGIGLVSFSAYLWHQPLFALARHRSLDEPDRLVFAGLVVASIVLAYFSWQYIEKPFRDRQRFKRGQIFLYAAIGSTVFLLLGLAGHATHGFEQARTTDAHRQVLKTAAASPLRAKCHTGGADYTPPAKACEINGGPLRVAVFGDSHAVELAYALAQGLEPRGIRLKQFTFSGCSPMFGRTVTGRDQPCADWTNEAANFIASHPDIDHVVVTYRIHGALFGSHERAYPGWPDTIGADERERRWAAYVGVLRHFVAHGKQVRLVLQAPELPKQIDALVLRASDPLAPIDGASRAWWTRRSAWVTARLAKLPAGVTVIDPAPLFCTGVSCLAASGGVARYFDDDHMSVGGARLVADQVLKGMAL